MTILLAILTVSCVSWIITREQLFARLRIWAKPKKWAYPLSCPFCLSVWVAALVFLVQGLEWRYFFPCVWGAFHSLAVFRRLKG